MEGNELSRQWILQRGSKHGDGDCAEYWHSGVLCVRGSGSWIGGLVLCADAALSRVEYDGEEGTESQDGTERRVGKSVGIGWESCSKPS